MTADTMPNCDSFYTRLGSIMEELANAAVAEICKLVDDGYAVLRLEMSRSHEENVALRKKLQLMEMQISHEYTKNSGVVEDSLHCGSGGTQVAVERRKNKSEKFKITITEEQTASSLWNQGKKAVHKEEDRDTLHVLLDKEGQPELVLIKEERPEENVCTEDSWEGLPETKSRIKGMETEDGQTNCPVNTETGPAEHTAKQGEHPRTGHTSCEVSREDSVLKAEKERDNTRQRVQYTDSELRTEALDYASSESVPNWRACQFDSLIEPGNRDTLTAEAACTNDAGTDSGSLPIHFVRGSQMNGSELFDKSLDPSTHGKACPKKKHFLCNYCGKDFARKNVLETHQRIHTGEKPFGCTQCEKRFSDSSNLKKHQSVHTGEKPFVCMQCGMRFSDSSSRKRHQSVHTGNKPFGCTQCGKRFTRLCHLKRHHQQIHMWPVPFEADSWCDTLKDTISKFTCS